MVALWRAQLGQYDDWNLYALAAQPIALLVFTRLVAGVRAWYRAPWLAAFVVLAATQAGAWVAEHHWLA
jgi:ABC-type transporter Mla maintaining outer membrane lipid asymmetry permease subunit MlaE